MKILNLKTDVERMNTPIVVNTDKIKRICTTCKKELFLKDFYKHKYSKYGRTPTCKICISDDRKRIRREKELGIYVSRRRKPRLGKEDREQRKIEIMEYQRNYRKVNAKILAEKKREYINKIKNEGLEHYGNKCECCGEKTKEFLTLEHKKGRNSDDKKLTGKKMWARAKAEGYPNKYTILCFNCNCAKGIYGVCPHELMRNGKCNK